MAIISWYKKYTETLESTLERFCSAYPQYKNDRVTYAGRLDPMAEGLLLLLTGADVHKKDVFLALEKIYEVDFILGLATDTYDILGLITEHYESLVPEKQLFSEIDSLVKITKQPYPPYSSKPVSGKPLWKWAKEGKINNIQIPEKSVQIREATYLGKRIMSAKELERDIVNAVNLVEGDFRQDEAINSWKSYFESSQLKNYKVYRIRVTASSGTYMRSLISSIGIRLGVGAVSLKIRRIQVGKYR